MYGPCTPPCTRHVYGRVHVSTCTRAVYTAVLHGRVRAIYIAEKGRLHRRTRPCNVLCIRPYTGRIGSCTQQCTGRVHGSFRPCSLALAVYTSVFDRLYSRTRPCNVQCTRPRTRAVWPCIRQVGLPGRVHVPRRQATAVCGPSRHTVRVRGRVHGPCRQTCTRLCMGCVHDHLSLIHI